VTYAEERLARLGRHFDRIMEVEVEFAEESRRGGPTSAVRITVHTDGRRHQVAQAQETGPDVRAALDLALDKVDRQVVKLKEKRKVERKRGVGAVEDDPEPGATAEVEHIRLKLQPQTLEDAEAALATSRHPCYVYLDEGSGMISVCFRRPDGGLTVLEPVVT
jgi:putative sigma-54 modulation protein